MSATSLILSLTLPICTALHCSAVLSRLSFALQTSLLHGGTSRRLYGTRECLCSLFTVAASLVVLGCIHSCVDIALFYSAPAYLWLVLHLLHGASWSMTNLWHCLVPLYISSVNLKVQCSSITTADGNITFRSHRYLYILFSYNFTNHIPNHGRILSLYYSS